MSTKHTCWACGRVTTSGICLGPHENYSHFRALMDHYVEYPDWPSGTRAVAPVKVRLAEKVCAWCGRLFESTGRATCSDLCLWAHRGREHAASHQRRTA